MSAFGLKHGGLTNRFMLCDRCVINGKCESHVPGGECAVERKAFEAISSELVGQYELRGLGDEICACRAAMYLIRIARVEAYEAQLGVNADSVLLGKYIAGLDKTLRVYLRELALTRSSQRILSRNDVLADIDELLNAVAKKAKDKSGARPRRYCLVQRVVRDWQVESRRLRVASPGMRVRLREDCV